MSGGGDTPKNTLWAYEYESGKFVLGVINDNVLNIQCETDSSDLWVVDAEGVYTENIALHSYLESEIVDAINAKYGTNFTELTGMPVSDVAIGEDCPNWNAYEKIEIQSQKIAAKIGTSFEWKVFIIGTLRGKDFEIVTNGDKSCVVRSNGYLESYNGPSAREAESIKGLLQSYGITATSISEKVISWEIGSKVPDWSEYTQYT